MYRKIYVPVDNSDHSNACVNLAVDWAKKTGASLVGSHVYAAKMHDKRFKQMEYTLPEEYLDEKELEKQRKIHDSLITMGLQLISDSYLDVLEKRACAENIPFERKMADGKHFEMIVKEVAEEKPDLVVIGALGTGAVKASVLGSVCERVARRVRVDTLVVKDIRPEDQQAGPIVVAIDGSPYSYAGLKKAIELARLLNRPLEAVAVYDPYLHYTVFNGIVNVLSEKASKVFKFKDQEQLHEEIIDTGLAKIYQSHLEVGRALAKEEGVDLKITLLDGKAFEKILNQAKKVNAWMLVMGRIGYHSPDDMDIGSNAENLLRLAPCNVMLVSGKFIPPIDLKADAAVTWTPEAEERMKRVPEFVRGVARTAVLRFALERGHSVITNDVIQTVMDMFMPKRSSTAIETVALDLALQEVQADSRVTYLCSHCGHAVRVSEEEATSFTPRPCVVCGADPAKIHKIDKDVARAMAEREGGFVDEETADGRRMRWSKEAFELTARVPAGYERRRVKAIIEKTARVRNLEVITKDFALAAIEDRELAETAAVAAPVPAVATSLKEGNGAFTWTEEAVARLNRVPQGFMRDNTRTKIEEYARARNVSTVDLDVAEGGIAEARKMMEEMIRGYAQGGQAQQTIRESTAPVLEKKA